MSRRINRALPLLTVLAFGLLAGWYGPQVQAAAGGLWPFDMRAAGYGLAEARAFLTALSPEGRALMLGPVRVTDTVFPILFTLTLCLPLRGRGWVWCLPALAYGLLDLAENMAVAVLVRAGPEVAAGPVALASGLTIGKYVALVLALVLALAALWQRRRER